MKIDIYLYWRDPPPEPSRNLGKWVGRIQNGWKPNKRISHMGYSEKAEFFQVYLWEYLNVLYPMLREYL